MTFDVKKRRIIRFLSHLACALLMLDTFPACLPALNACRGWQVDRSRSSDSKCALSQIDLQPTLPNSLLLQLWVSPAEVCRISEVFPEEWTRNMRDQLHFGELLARLHLRKIRGPCVLIHLGA